MAAESAPEHHLGVDRDAIMMRAPIFALTVLLSLGTQPTEAWANGQRMPSCATAGFEDLRNVNTENYRLLELWALCAADAQPKLVARAHQEIRRDLRAPPSVASASAASPPRTLPETATQVLQEKLNQCIANEWNGAVDPGIATACSPGVVPQGPRLAAWPQHALSCVLRGGVGETPARSPFLLQRTIEALGQASYSTAQQHLAEISKKAKARSALWVDAAVSAVAKSSNGKEILAAMEAARSPDGQDDPVGAAKHLLKGLDDLNSALRPKVKDRFCPDGPSEGGSSQRCLGEIRVEDVLAQQLAQALDGKQSKEALDGLARAGADLDAKAGELAKQVGVIAEGLQRIGEGPAVWEALKQGALNQFTHAAENELARLGKINGAPGLPSLVGTFGAVVANGTGSVSWGAVATKLLPADVQTKLELGSNLYQQFNKVTSGTGDAGDIAALAGATATMAEALGIESPELKQAADIAGTATNMATMYFSGNWVGLASSGMAMLGGGGLAQADPAAVRHEAVMTALKDISIQLQRIERRLEDVIKLQEETLDQLAKMSDQIASNHAATMKSLYQILELQQRVLDRINFYGATFTRECFAAPNAVRLLETGQLGDAEVWSALRGNRSHIARCLEGLQLFLQNALDGETYAYRGIVAFDPCRDADMPCGDIGSSLTAYRWTWQALREFGLFASEPDAQSERRVALWSYAYPVADVTGLEGKIAAYYVRADKAAKERTALPDSPFSRTACGPIFAPTSEGAFVSALATNARKPAELLEGFVSDDWIASHAALAAEFHSFFDLLPLLEHSRPNIILPQDSSTSAKILLCHAKIALRLAIAQQALLSGDYGLWLIAKTLLPDPKNTAAPRSARQQVELFRLLRYNPIFARNLVRYLVHREYARNRLTIQSYSLAWQHERSCVDTQTNAPGPDCLMLRLFPRLDGGKRQADGTPHLIHYKDPAARLYHTTSKENAQPRWVLRFRFPTTAWKDARMDKPRCVATESSAAAQDQQPRNMLCRDNSDTEIVLELGMPSTAELYSGRFDETPSLWRLLAADEQVTAELAMYEAMRGSAVAAGATKTERSRAAAERGQFRDGLLQAVLGAIPAKLDEARAPSPPPARPPRKRSPRPDPGAGAGPGAGPCKCPTSPRAS
jgi:hypothetical protein